MVLQQAIKSRVGNKKSHKATLIAEKTTEGTIIKPEASTAEYSAQNVAFRNVQQHEAESIAHIPVLILLSIGIILQLSGNSFCVLAGLLICVSVCGIICIYVCASAIFSRGNLDSSSGLPGHAATIADASNEFRIEISNVWKRRALKS